MGKPWGVGTAFWAPVWTNGPLPLPIWTNIRVLRPSIEDVQARVPTASRSRCPRVGVTAVEKIVRIRRRRHEQLFSARIECFVDLGPHQKGAHMSRFEEVVNEAIGEVVLGEATFRAETLAQRIASSSASARTPAGPR